MSSKGNIRMMEYVFDSVESETRFLDTLRAREQQANNKMHNVSNWVTKLDNIFEKNGLDDLKESQKVKNFQTAWGEYEKLQTCLEVVIGGPQHPIPEDIERAGSLLATCKYNCIRIYDELSCIDYKWVKNQDIADMTNHFNELDAFYTPYLVEPKGYVKKKNTNYVSR